MVTPSVNITSTEDGFLIEDNTDYSSQQLIGTYAFFDYTSGLPLFNTAYNTTIINVGVETVLNDLIEFHTDGDGNIHDAEEAYNHIVDVVNEGEYTVKARLNKFNNSSFRVWRVEFYTFDNLKDGDTVVVTSTLTPLVETNLTGLNEILFRNLIIVNPKGLIEDIGGVAQEESILFNYSQYEIGQAIALSFCDSEIIYEITNADTDCIISDLVALINASTIGDDYYTLEAIGTPNTLNILQTNDGNPFQVSIAYSDGLLDTPFTQDTVVPNTPSMTVPTLTSVNTYDFIEYERGGKYLVTLSIGNVCDFNTTTVNYYSWVFDKKELDCCFNKKLLSETCCAKTDEKIIETSALRNIIYGIEIGERDKIDPDKIQLLVDLGYDMCDDCGCGGTGDCGGC